MIANSWCKSLLPATDNKTVVPLALLLTILVRNGVLQPILSQIAWALSKDIEKGLGASVKDEVKRRRLNTPRSSSEEDSLVLRWAEHESDDPRGFRLDRQLASYVLESEALIKNDAVIGLPTDKGNGIGTHQLQNTVVILPSSKAFLCCPQVLLHI